MVFPTRRAFALLAFVMTACAGPTETIVLVDLDAGLRERASELTVRVFDTDGAMVLDRTVPLEGLELPARIPLTPMGDDAARTFRVEAEAQTDYGCALGQGEVAGGYEGGQHVETPLDLALDADACPEVFVDRNEGRNDDAACVDVATPCSSIGYALDNYVANGRVRVVTLAAGQIFEDRNWLSEEHNGTEAEPVIVRGVSDRERPRIESDEQYFLSLSNIRWVTIQHIQFRGDAISANSGQGIRFVDDLFTGFVETAVQIGIGIDGMTVERCVFSGNPRAISLHWDTHNVSILDNVVVDNDDGISLQGVNTRVIGNQICDNAGFGISARREAEINHNTIVRNGGAGISTERMARVTDNLLAFNGGGAVEVVGGAPEQITLRRNLMWPADEPVRNTEPDSTDIVSDPMITVEECGAIALDPASPAIGSGLDGSTIGAWQPAET